MPTGQRGYGKFGHSTGVGVDGDNVSGILLRHYRSPGKAVKVRLVNWQYLLF